jgi:hypothetical protein
MKKRGNERITENEISILGGDVITSEVPSERVD